MHGVRFTLTAFIVFILSQPLLKEAAAGIIVENGRITSWTLDTDVAGLAAGTVISFSLGSWDNLPVTPSTATMPWWGTSPVNVYAPTPDTDAANLRDALKSLAAASGDQSIENSTYTYLFSYYEFDWTGGSNIYNRGFSYSTNLSQWYNDDTIYGGDVVGTDPAVTYAYIGSNGGGGAAVPEPSTALLTGLIGVVGFVSNRRRRRQVSAA